MEMWWSGGEMRMRCAASVCAWLKSVRSPTGFRVGLFERAWEAASARTIGVVGSRGLRPGRRWRRLRDTAWTAWCCWWRPGSRPARAQSGGCARRVSMGRGHHGAAPWPRAHPCSSRGSDTKSFKTGACAAANTTRIQSTLHKVHTRPSPPPRRPSSRRSRATPRGVGLGAIFACAPARQMGAEGFSVTPAFVCTPPTWWERASAFYRTCG